MYNLYETIINICKHKGVSGGKMCNDLGISRSIMTDLKMGRKKTISFETAKKMADYLDVSVDEIYGSEEQEEHFTVEEAKDDIFSKIKVLLDLAQNVSEEDLNRVIKILEAFKKEE